MRLHTLTFSAFGPFAGTETIDFDQLADAGLFLLHGPTGAGKTTILDAISFALFARVPGIRICAKTGTAQVQDVNNKKTGQTTWFASFAPYEQPRYAVVVMVENGVYGGTTCGPVAHDIYSAILEQERSAPGKPQTLAKDH